MKRFGSYLNMLLVVGLIAISSSAFGQTTKASLATGKIKAVLDGDTYIVTTDDGDAVLEVKEGKAILRYPGREKDHAERENDVLPALRDDKAL